VNLEELFNFKYFFWITIKVFLYYNLPTSGKDEERRRLFPTPNSFFCLSLGSKQVQLLKHRSVEIVNYLRTKGERCRNANLFKRL